MKIKKDIEYAIIGLVSLANKKASSVMDIAKENDISPTFLAKIFQKLSKAKILKSQFGPGGGYTFLKSINTITFYDIISVLQKEDIHDIISFKPSSKSTPKTYMDKIIANANKKIIEEFKKITIKHFLFYFLS